MLVRAGNMGVPTPIANIAVYGQSNFTLAMAVLLAGRNHPVAVLGASEGKKLHCDITTQTRVRYTINCQTAATPEVSKAGSCDAVIIAVPATEYGATVVALGPHLKSGQTLFIVGAAFGAALEFETRLQARHKDLSVSIVEISRPFTSVKIEHESIWIDGVKETLSLAGRTLNATRSGLSVGRSIFNGLVPASNIFDRGFFDLDKWLETAALLFSVLDSKKGEAVSTVFSSLHAEFQMLAKAYGLNRVPEAGIVLCPSVPADPIVVLRDRLAEDFVILSSLARLRHLPMPVLDSIIELASVVTACDLRKGSRQLEDLGLIGMDAQEIIELVGA